MSEPRQFVIHITHRARIALAIVCACASARASIFSSPTENPTAKNALAVVEAELTQNHPADAVRRADALLKDRPADLLPAEEGRLVSVRTAVTDFLTRNRKSLQEEYDKQFGTAAWQMLAAARQAPAYQPEDLYPVAVRYPLSAAAAQALTNCSDRAVEFGDPFAAAIFHNLSSAAITTQPAAFVDSQTKQIPFAASWYGNAESMPLPRYLPSAAGGAIFISTPRTLLSFSETGALNWQWSMPRPWQETTPVDHFSDVARGTLLSPAIFVDSGNLPRIVVARQLLSSMREYGIRAFRASDGKLLWATESDQALSSMIFVGEPVLAGRYVYAVALQDAASGCNMIMVALDVTNGRPIWQTIIGVRPDTLKGENRREVDRAGEEFWQSSPPLVDQDEVVVTPNCGFVVAMDRFTGEIRWITSYASQPPASDAMRKYRTLRLAGKHPPVPMSQSQAIRWTSTAVASGGAIVAAPQDTPSAIALDRSNGKILWSANDLVAPTLIAAGPGVAIFAGDNVAALDSLTGQLRWHYLPANGAAINGPPAIRSGSLYVPTTRGIVSLSLSDGQEEPSATPVPSLQKLLTSSSVKKALEDVGALRWLSP